MIYRGLAEEFSQSRRQSYKFTTEYFNNNKIVKCKRHIQTNRTKNKTVSDKIKGSMPHTLPSTHTQDHTYRKRENSKLKNDEGPLCISLLR